MKLIVGLGNPGKQYENTRHNIGYMVLDAYAKAHQISFQKEKFQGIYAEFWHQEEKVILLKPLTFMNLSGEAVRRYMDFFHIAL